MLGEGIGINFRCAGGPPGKDFGSILAIFPVFQSFVASPFVPSSPQVCPNSRSVIVLPLVPGLGCSALQLQGQWSRGACEIKNNLQKGYDSLVLLVFVAVVNHHQHHKYHQ